jgi:hypothetical protein
MKKIVRLTESDLTRIVKRVINERSLLTEGLDNTVLQLVTPPLPINRTVCSTGQDQFAVQFTVKNTGSEIAYLTMVAPRGKGIGGHAQLDHKVTINKVSKHSNHDNGKEQAIVPKGQTAVITVIVKTQLSLWLANINNLFNLTRSETNPKKHAELEAQWRAAKATSPFDAAADNKIIVEYNGGTFNVPLDIKNLKLGNISCEAPIDLVRGF